MRLRVLFAIVLSLSVWSCSSPTYQSDAVGPKPDAPQRSVDPHGVETELVGCPELSTSGAMGSSWFGVLKDLDELEFILRAEDPSHPGVSTSRGEPSDKCLDGELCSTWTSLSEWRYVSLCGAVGVTQQGRGGEKESNSLLLEVEGRFVVGELSRTDYSCPKVHSDECYPDADPVNPEETRMVCESDMSVVCTESGRRGILEVLDVERQVVHRLENFRKREVEFRLAVLDSGKLELFREGCELRGKLLSRTMCSD